MRGRIRSRGKLAFGRGLARADSLVAALAFWYAGLRTADRQWAWAAAGGVVGLVFLVSSGDYCWRKGFTAARREG